MTLPKDTSIFFYQDPMENALKGIKIPSFNKNGYEYQWLLIDYSDVYKDIHQKMTEKELRGKFVNDSLYEGYLGGKDIPKNQWQPFKFVLNSSTTDIIFQPIKIEKKLEYEGDMYSVNFHLLKPKHNIHGSFLEKEILKIFDLTHFVNDTILYKKDFEKYLEKVKSALSLRFKEKYIKGIDMSLHISYIDKNIISFFKEDRIDNGDVRCWANYDAFTYDIRTKKPIKFNDIFIKGQESKIKQLIEAKALSSNIELKMTDIEHFYLTNKGIMFVFGVPNQFAACDYKYPIQIFFSFQSISHLIDFKKLNIIISK